MNSNADTTRRYSVYSVLGPVEEGERKKPFTLTELQALVGGYIEIRSTGERLAVLDEEGFIKKKPLNLKASKVLGFSVFGCVIICDPELIN